ncbi:ACP S-malonyltransferase [Candidatus Dependentiae bacterium]|nr:ACP S-malonyltransferase [Candidatus Dependentiae bacterium]
MSTKRIGIVFPGYGQQYIGMCKDLYDHHRIVQEFFEQASASCDINFVKLLFASSDEEIFSIRNGYLAIFLFEVSLYEILYKQGLRPDFVAGYGIGEYAAAYATRSLSFVDSFYILNKYSQFYYEFIQDKSYDCLRIVREFTLEDIEKLCEKKSTKTKVAYVSAQNTQHAFYIAGHIDVLEKVQEHCIKNVIRKVRIIGPEYGMQSNLVDQIVEQLKLYYHKIKFAPLQVPLITNVDGVYVTTPDALESSIMRKINHRIEWHEVIQGFQGCDIIMSIGPGDQLIEWFKEVYPDKEYYQVQTLKDFQGISQYLKESELEIQANTSTDTMQQSVEKNLEQSKFKNLYEADLINEKSSDFDIEDD